MTHASSPKRDVFSSKFGVIAAAAGSAVGLGNIWRFPYVAGENGGGAFLVVYLFFILLIGIPVMMSEFTIGRRAQRNPIGAFKALKPGRPWYLVGVMGVGAAFMILAFYSAVAGWTLEYIYRSLTDSFSGKTPNELDQMFTHFKSGSLMPVVWQLVFMFMTAWIVIAGVQKGIERYAKILMPVLFLLVLVLDLRAVTLEGAGEGLSFLFKPDFSKLTSDAVLEALGQAFFSLSIGMGTLITYGSYIGKTENLGFTAVTVAGADTAIAVLAGVAIFPAVFAFGIEPGSGPGLVFITLPNIFQQMPGGYFFSLMFFVLLAVAALTSSISVLEVVVAYFVEELNIVRRKATIIATLLISILGVMCALSWGAMADYKLFGKNVFEIMDFTASNILLPLGGLCIVLFIGWFFKEKYTRDEITNNGTLFKSFVSPFIFLVRFIAPVAIALVFLNGLGLLNF